MYIAKSLSKLIFRKVKLLPKQSGKEKRSLVAEIIAITVTHKHTLKQTNKETPTAITMNMNEEVVFLEWIYSLLEKHLSFNCGLVNLCKIPVAYKQQKGSEFGIRKAWVGFPCSPYSVTEIPL